MTVGVRDTAFAGGLIALAIGCVSLTPLAAHAASPVGNAGTAQANPGRLSLEARVGYSLDEDGGSNDERIRSRVHVDYGWSDWYAARVVLEQDRQADDRFRHRAVSYENRLQVFERAKHGWDGGVRVIYGRRENTSRANELDLRLMGQVPIGRAEWRTNTIFDTTFGNNTPQYTLELRNQLTWSVAPPVGLASLRLGVESFNDIGEVDDPGDFDAQDHQLGPVAKLRLQNGVALQLGYRAGLSDAAPDHVLKAFVTRSFSY